MRTKPKGVIPPPPQTPDKTRAKAVEKKTKILYKKKLLSKIIKVKS